MFKSVIFFKSPKYGPYIYKIIDDDFEEEYEVNLHDSIEADANAIIKCYSSRNLNVVKNLILFMKYRAYPISEQIYLYKKYATDFEKYLPEIEKYINLL